MSEFSQLPKVAFVYAILLLAGLALAPDTVSARDRPGTPNNEVAFTCHTKNQGKPAVCVRFHNTASEEVYFDIEFTANGVPVTNRREIKSSCDAWEGGQKKRCIGCPPRSKPVWDCAAASSFVGGAATTQGRTGIDKGPGDIGVALPQFIRLDDLEWHTKYCFRFKARRASDKVVSAQWSNWACADTGAPPVLASIPKPTSPTGVEVEYIAPGRDWRVKPPKVVVKWFPSANAVRQCVESTAKGVEAQQEGGCDSRREGDRLVWEGALKSETYVPDDKSSAYQIANKIQFKVCAYNSAGERACSAAVSASIASSKDKVLDVETDATDTVDRAKQLEIMPSNQESPKAGDFRKKRLKRAFE